MFLLSIWKIVWRGRVILGHDGSWRQSRCSGDIEKALSTYVMFCWWSQENWWGIMKKQWESSITLPLLRMCQYTASQQRKGETNICWRFDTPNWHYRVYKSQNPMMDALVLPGTGGKISFCSFQHHFSRSLTCLTWSIPGRSAELTMSSHHLLLTFTEIWSLVPYRQIQLWVTAPA